MAMTTIEIPVELRDRINEDARAQGVSAAGFIEQLMDAHDRNRRMQPELHSFWCFLGCGLCLCWLGGVWFVFVLVGWGVWGVLGTLKGCL